MLVGRKKEKQILLNTLNKNSSSFIAIYGRRRIGKTFLVEETFNHQFYFKHTGLANLKKSDELKEFGMSLKRFGFKGNVKFYDWLDAFNALEEFIGEETDQKKVIFLDELSWLDTPKGKFVPGLEQFWNGWASVRKDIILIVSASVTSWIMNNVIHNVGGLYNRLTNQIELLPFCLGECEQMIKSLGINSFSRQNITEYYMIFGGIPFYWSLLNSSLTMEQNVDAILFDKGAPLKNEYQSLYSSLFTYPEKYEQIIKFLVKKKIGFSKKDIVESLDLVDNGHLSKILTNLELCGFIRTYLCYGKRKNKMYQVIDPFTLFYFSFLEDKKISSYFSLINTPKSNTWKGFAFERLCHAHISQIKEKLRVLGINSEEYFFNVKEDLENRIYGSQIDLVIDRDDKVINLCEMKYCQIPYILTKDDYLSLTKKKNDFINVTKTRKAISLILITPLGLHQNEYYSSINNIVDEDDLFKIID